MSIIEDIQRSKGVLVWSGTRVRMSRLAQMLIRLAQWVDGVRLAKRGIFYDAS